MSRTYQQELETKTLAIDTQSSAGGREPRPEGPNSEPWDSNRVVVISGSTFDTFYVHHRDVPELHACGGSLREAADNLVLELSRELDDLADRDRRDLFTQMLADVRAFVIQGPELS